MRTRRLLALALSGLACGGLAACGDDFPDPNAGSAIDGDLATPLPKTLQSASAPAVKERKPGEPLPAAGLKGVPTDLKTKPKVPKGSGEAPSELKGDDVVVGKGKEAKKGDKVSVQYVGVLFKNGKEFDSSWKRKQEPFEFTIGEGSVIKGWDQGVPGMKVGGRRTLVIPADLAYGAAGSPPNIGPDEPLIFVIDLKKIG